MKIIITISLLRFVLMKTRHIYNISLWKLMAFSYGHNVHKNIGFHVLINRTRQHYQFPLWCIGNLDETPLNFDMLANKMVNVKRLKMVLVKHTVHEKTWFTTVVLCVFDGTKLRPLVIFKQKNKPKINLLSCAFFHFQEKRMDGRGRWEIIDW